MSAEKTSADPHLLARVLDDAREASERSGRAFQEAREEVLLRNAELFRRYSELSNDRHLVAYFARVEHPNSAMAPSDVAPMTALLDRSEEIRDLDLLIHSPGGSAQTAEKLVAACRTVAQGEFRVAVPNMAKSAATMTALGADQIVMGYLSELGPIDPQIPVLVGGYNRFISAQSFLDGQKETLEAVSTAQQAGKPVIGYLQLLGSPDMSAAWITEMRREIKFGKDMVSKHLKQYMLPRVHTNDDARALGLRAARIANNLSQANKRFSHGRMIGAEEARDEVGLDVAFLDRADDRWSVLWEIYVRMEIFIQTFPTLGPEDFGPAKLFADAEQTQISG